MSSPSVFSKTYCHHHHYMTVIMIIITTTIIITFTTIANYHCHHNCYNWGRFRRSGKRYAYDTAYDSILRVFYSANYGFNAIRFPTVTKTLLSISLLIIQAFHQNINDGVNNRRSLVSFTVSVSRVYKPGLPSFTPHGYTLCDPLETFH